jgi:hypothetical protein
MIDPRNGAEWEEVWAGLVYVESRRLDDDERAMLERHLARATRVLAASLAWIAFFPIASIYFITHRVPESPLTFFVCIGAMFGVPTAFGYGSSAWTRRRRLRRDLAANVARIFRGDTLVVTEDAAIQFLINDRFVAAQDEPAAPITVDIALLTSGLPLPRVNERLSPHIARPFRIARPPPTDRDAPARTLTSAERDELRFHASRSRRVSIELGVGVVYSALSMVAVAMWITHHGLAVPSWPPIRIVQALIWNVIGVAAMLRVWSRRSFARALERSAASGDVRRDGRTEWLASGLPWCERGVPAAWRRG